MTNVRDLILGCNDLDTKTIHVDEWGTDLTIRALNMREFKEVDKASNNGEDQMAMLVHTLIRGVVDEHGDHQFTTKDVPALYGKSQVAIVKVASEILLLSGLGGAEDESEKK